MGAAPCIQAPQWHTAGSGGWLEGCNGSQDSFHSQPFVKVDIWHFVSVLGHDAVPQLRLKVRQRKGASLREQGTGCRHHEEQAAGKGERVLELELHNPSCMVPAQDTM